MTFHMECMGGELSRAIGVAAHARGSASKYPLLEACRIAVADGAATLSTTNLDQSLSIEIAAAGSGDAFASMALLSGKAGALIASKPVVIDGDANSIAIKQGRTRWTVPIMPGFGWPEVIFKPPGGDKKDVPSALLFRALNIVKSAMVPDTAMTGVHYHGMLIDADGFCVGTDGHRLAVVEGGAGKTIGSLIFPRNALPIAEGIFRGDDQVTFYSDENAIALEADGVYFRTKLIEGKYPDWRRVVKASCEPMIYRTTFDREALTDAIRRAMLIREDRNKSGSSIELILTMAGDECAMTCKNAIGEQGADACEALGDNGKFGINGLWLLEALATFACDRVAVRFGDLGTAGYICIEPEVSTGAQNFRIIALRQIAG